MPDNVVLIMRFHPVGGEDVSVISEDFTGEHEALEAVARALDERRSLVLRHARYDREADENGVIINLANVVSVRVSKTDSAAGHPTERVVRVPPAARPECCQDTGNCSSPTVSAPVPQALPSAVSAPASRADSWLRAAW